MTHSSILKLIHLFRQKRDIHEHFSVLVKPIEKAIRQDSANVYTDTFQEIVIKKRPFREKSGFLPLIERLIEVNKELYEFSDEEGNTVKMQDEVAKLGDDILQLYSQVMAAVDYEQRILGPLKNTLVEISEKMDIKKEWEENLSALQKFEILLDRDVKTFLRLILRLLKKGHLGKSLEYRTDKREKAKSWYVGSLSSNDFVSARRWVKYIQNHGWFEKTEIIFLMNLADLIEEIHKTHNSEDISQLEKSINSNLFRQIFTEEESKFFEKILDGLREEKGPALPDVAKLLIEERVKLEEDKGEAEQLKSEGTDIQRLQMDIEKEIETVQAAIDELFKAAPKLRERLGKVADALLKRLKASKKSILEDLRWGKKKSAEYLAKDWEKTKKDWEKLKIKTTGLGKAAISFGVRDIEQTKQDAIKTLEWSVEKRQQIESWLRGLRWQLDEKTYKPVFYFDIGKEQIAGNYNEDALSCKESFARKEGCLFAGVYDGFYGQFASEMAAKRMPELFMHFLFKLKDIEAAFDNAYAYLSLEIKNSYNKTGTTAANVFVIGSKLYIAHAGDSRVLVCVNDKVKFATIDHILDNSDEKNRVFGTAMLSQNRMSENGQYFVTRALGFRDAPRGIIPNPSISAINLDSYIKKGIIRVVIYSDGVFHSKIRNEIVASIVSGFEKAQDSASMLAKTAKLRSTTGDDITVMVIKLIPIKEKLRQFVTPAPVQAELGMQATAETIEIRPIAPAKIEAEVPKQTQQKVKLYLSSNAIEITIKVNKRFDILVKEHPSYLIIGPKTGKTYKCVLSAPKQETGDNKKIYYFEKWVSSRGEEVNEGTFRALFNDDVTWTAVYRETTRKEELIAKGRWIDTQNEATVLITSNVKNCVIDVNGAKIAPPQSFKGKKEIIKFAAPPVYKLTAALTATDSLGKQYKFSQWEIDKGGKVSIEKKNPIEVTISEPVEYTAIYKPT